MCCLGRMQGDSLDMQRSGSGKSRSRWSLTWWGTRKKLGVLQVHWSEVSIYPPLINEKGERAARDTEKQFITSLHWQSVITDEMLRTVPEGKWNSAGLLGRCVGIEVLKQGGWGPCEGSWEPRAASRQFWAPQQCTGKAGFGKNKMAPSSSLFAKALSLKACHLKDYKMLS